MACLQENIIEKKRLENITNYRQIAYEIRERRPGFKVEVVLLVISAFDGGIRELLKELENMFEKDDLCKKIEAEMQKTILIESQTIIQKVPKDSPEVAEYVYDNNNIVQGANKLLGGPSIWLYDLNWKDSYNLHNNNNNNKSNNNNNNNNNNNKKNGHKKKIG